MRCGDLTPGAELGAFPCGPHRTAVDVDGLGRPSFRALRTPLDIYGRRLEIYGSGGWVFESPPGALQRAW